jgi:hypothetical protein
MMRNRFKQLERFDKLTKGKNVPNFLEYIYEEGLKAVKPEAVNIIR